MKTRFNKQSRYKKSPQLSKTCRLFFYPKFGNPNLAELEGTASFPAFWLEDLPHSSDYMAAIVMGNGNYQYCALKISCFQ